MADSESSFERECMRLAARAALRVFRFRWDRDERVADAVSEAWHRAQTAPRAIANATVIARYAVRHVAIGRQFRQFIRSIDHPAPRDGKPVRSGFDVAFLGGVGDDPAELAAFRVDFREWFAGLADRERAIATALAIGERGKDIALRFGLSRARVSQIRAELAERWYASQE